MKKILLFLILLIPFNVLADDIENFYFNATILENGDLEIEEYFNLDGYYNGMERKINFKNVLAPFFNPNAEKYGGSQLHNGDKLILEEIRAVDVNNNFDFQNINGDIFKENASAQKGDYGYYTISDNLTGQDYRIFLPSYKNKAFYLKYKISNMAIIHNDVGELGWNVFDKTLTENIQNVKVTINIPNNKKMIKIWGHGPLNGETKIINSQKVSATVKNLMANTAFDIRLAFDKNVISKSNKKTNVDALPKIIKYETILADEANAEREKLKAQEIEKIEIKFQKLELIPSRINYDDIESSISDLQYIDNQDTYRKKLLTYQDKVDAYEYQEFKYHTNILKYYAYEQARESSSLVFNDNLRKQIEKEFVVYEKQFYKHEYCKELIIIVITLIFVGISYLALFKNKIPSRIIKRVNPKYNRDIPEINCAEAGLLMNKNLSKNEISAVILDFIKRKIILLKKTEKDYLLSLNVNLDTLNYNEQKFLKMLFNDSKNISLKKRKAIKYSAFKTWQKWEMTSLIEKKYILKKDRKESKNEISILWLILGVIFCLTFKLFLVGLILLIYYGYRRYHENIYLYFILLLNIFLILVSLVFDYVHISMNFLIITSIIIYINLHKMPRKLDIKLTEKGKKELNNLYAIRNFLNDFAKFDDKEITQIVLWEDYLIYATLFGISKKVLKNIKLKIINPDLINENVLFDMTTLNLINTSAKTMARTIAVASRPHIYLSSGGGSSSSSSSFSSGSGSGGGFSGGSSGGGSFGGGSGGGRF